MNKIALIAAAALTFGCLLTGCSTESDPNETAVIKGEPAGGAPEGAKRPSNPFAGAPDGMGGPAGGKGGMKKSGSAGGAPTPGAGAAAAPNGQ